MLAGKWRLTPVIHRSKDRFTIVSRFGWAAIAAEAIIRIALTAQILYRKAHQVDESAAPRCSQYHRGAYLKKSLLFHVRPTGEGGTARHGQYLLYAADSSCQDIFFISSFALP